MKNNPYSVPYITTFSADNIFLQILFWKKLSDERIQTNPVFVFIFDTSCIISILIMCKLSMQFIWFNKSDYVFGSQHKTNNENIVH